MTKLKEKNRKWLEKCYIEDMIEVLLSDDDALRDFVDEHVEKLTNEELLDAYKVGLGRY